ncbi:hypothetical protein Tco_1115177 [Tanacetum coccineum]
MKKQPLMKTEKTVVEANDVMVISSDDEAAMMKLMTLYDNEDVVPPTVVQPHVPVLSRKPVFSLMDKPDTMKNFAGAVLATEPAWISNGTGEGLF